MAILQVQDVEICAEFFVLTPADDLILRQFSTQKADYFKELLEAKTAQARLIETLGRLKTCYLDGFILASQFLKAH